MTSEVGKQNNDSQIKDIDLQIPNLIQQNEKNSESPYGISKQELIKVMESAEVRNFSEEIDELERLTMKYSEQNQTDYYNWLFKALKTSKTAGLDKSDFDIREQVFGHNRRQEVPLKSFFSLLCEALEDFTLRILMVAAIVSIIVEEATADDTKQRKIGWIEGFAILVAVFVCSTVAAGNDYSKAKQFQKLNKVAEDTKKILVIRNGEKEQIHQDLIMVGDIVQLRSGMEIPGDGIILEAADISVDESVMTGEPDPVQKDTIYKGIERRDQYKRENIKPSSRHEIPSPIVMSGTTLLSGEGWYMPIVIGKDSCKGKIEEKLKSDEDSATPLQEKLEKIAEDIGKFGLYSGVGIICALLIRFIIERIIEKEFDKSKHIEEIIHFFLVAVAIIVMAIPEGLPLAVTLSLAFSTRKMLADKNLVRKLEACETMGGADNICSDKTGTLTQNKMILTNIWNYKMIEINVDEDKYDINTFIPSQIQEIFLQSIGTNNAAEMKQSQENGKPVLREIGSATELAFIKFMKKCNINYEDWVNKYTIIEPIPFTSTRKMMSRVIQYKQERRILVKGASEIVLESCTKCLQFSTNKIIEIDQTIKTSINDAINLMAQRALRTICLAYKTVSNDEDIEKKDNRGVRDVEKHNLILVAICGIRDPPRAGVKEAVLTCQKAGITVRMVTGDNQNTARAIAAECGIITQGSDQLVMLGEEFMRAIGGVICQKCQTVNCDCPRFIVNKDQIKEEEAKKKKDDKGDNKQTDKKAQTNGKQKKNDNFEEDEEEKRLDIENQKSDKKSESKDDKKNGKKDEKKAEKKADKKDDKKDDKPKIRIDTIKNKDKFNEIYPKLAVLARSRPEDKYALVVGLMEQKHVVAVTGDGTNDAPALKKADVGFAMGIAGTQVAKDAADIIITDDNFASIVKAVLWGRNIYDSIKKFLQFQLTVNVVGVLMTLISAIVVKQELLQPIQMLWINLIMDTFASLALATEPPNDKLLDRQPHKRDDYIVTPKMFKHIIISGIFQLTIMLILAFDGEYFLPEYRDRFDTDKKLWEMNKENTESKLFWKYNVDQLSDTDKVKLYYYVKDNAERPSKLYVHSGRLRTYKGSDPDYRDDAEDDTPSRHFTIIFNTFVFLQFFNFLNARKIDDEVNIFKNIFNNMVFFIIIVIILILQIIFVTFGGRAMKCYKYSGLTIQQWFICIGFGALGLVVTFLAKLINEKRLLPGFGKSQKQIQHSGILGARRSKYFDRKLSSINFQMKFGSKRESQKIQSMKNRENPPDQKDTTEIFKQEGPRI